MSYDVVHGCYMMAVPKTSEACVSKSTDAWIFHCSCNCSEA